MEPQEHDAQHARLAENLALLSILDHVPTLPPATTSTAPAECDEESGPQAPTYKLSLKDEQNLASGLAFFAGDSDHDDHAMSVCVQQTQEPDGLIICLAINKPNFGDVDNLHEKVKTELFFLLRLIAQSTQEDADRERILSVIIRFCRIRILKSIGSRRPDVLPLYATEPGTHLGKIINAVRDLVDDDPVVRTAAKPARKSFLTRSEDSFVTISQDLSTTLDGLERRHEVDVAMDLPLVVSTARRLLRASKHVADSFRRATGRELLPAMQQTLETRLADLARYWEVADGLCDIAMRNPKLLTNVNLVSVDFAEDCFPKLTTPTVASPQSLESCVLRCSEDKRTAFRLCKTLFERLTDPSKHFETMRKESDVHAEVQILAYYHLYPCKNPPRVIASSKDSCYLCQKLIHLAGNRILTGAYGGLCTDWRLPLLIFDGLLDKLNCDLELEVSSLVQSGPPSRLSTVVSPTESCSDQMCGAEDHKADDHAEQTTTHSSYQGSPPNNSHLRAGSNNEKLTTEPESQPQTVDCAEGLLAYSASLRQLELGNGAARSDEDNTPGCPTPSSVQQPSSSMSLLPAQSFVVKLQPETGSSNKADLLRMLDDFVRGNFVDGKGASAVHVTSISGEQAIKALLEGKVPILDIQSAEQVLESEEAADYILVRHGDGILKIGAAKH